MKRIALLLTLLISTFHFSVFAQDMTLSKDSFEGNFVIDSTFTRDGGKTFEVSASGDAGPYGRAYLSYVFTDKQNLGTAGEFTGFGLDTKWRRCRHRYSSRRLCKTRQSLQNVHL